MDNYSNGDDNFILEKLSPDNQATLKEVQTAMYLHAHFSLDMEDKINSMYKILVTGNGVPSFQERVRRLEALSHVAMWLGSVVMLAVGELLFDIFTGRISLLFGH
jgi:hypothetical protein